MTYQHYTDEEDTTEMTPNEAYKYIDSEKSSLVIVGEYLLVYMASLEKDEKAAKVLGLKILNIYVEEYIDELYHALPEDRPALLLALQLRGDVR